jgi:hypothetical protein
MPGPLQGAAANARQTAQEKGGRTMRGDMSRLNADHVRRLRLILTLLDNATKATDMNFPGSGLHALRGDFPGLPGRRDHLSCPWAVPEVLRSTVVHSVPPCVASGPGRHAPGARYIAENSRHGRQTKGHGWRPHRATVPQAFRRHDKVVETDQEPDPALVAPAAPGQTAYAAPQATQTRNQLPSAKAVCTHSTCWGRRCECASCSCTPGTATFWPTWP